MIAIIDYGVGNLKNVYNALKKLEIDSIITSDQSTIDNSDAIILPGVGAFNNAINHLEQYDMIDCIHKNVNKGKFLLGICLGMQLLFEQSYEDGKWNGLGLMKGEIVRFPNTLKVPHMGWNDLIKNTEDTLTKGIHPKESVYFVHSYYLSPKDWNDVIFYSDYGVKVPAVVRKENIIGMQFHPEKSGRVGMKLLKNFKELIK